LRVELSGYSYAYLPASIRLIGDEALGPREVRRYLGDELGDAVEVEGPRVLVEAELATTSFVIEDQTLRFVDGMAGLAEAEVRRERIVTLLVPALRLLLNE
jgi:membrane fusion protein (multidrug efflux system)